MRLEVLDRATHEALERLIAAGLIAPVTRAARPLHPVVETPAPLSDTEKTRAGKHRELAARKLKMTRLLSGGGLADEAREPLLDDALVLGRALAIENRLPEPGSCDEAWAPPLAAAWGVSTEALRAFRDDPDAGIDDAVGVIEQALKEG